VLVGRAVNVGSPVFDLIDSTVTVFESLILEDPQLPGEEPSEHGSHEEADGNHTDDEDEGEAKDDVRSNATDALGIDETNSGDILQTLTKCPLVGPEEVHGEIPAVEGTIGALQLVNRRIFDLSRGQPVEEVHVDARSWGRCENIKTGWDEVDLRLEDGQITAGVADISQSETKCEETSSSHEDEDDTEEADLLSPSPLLLWSLDAASSEKSGRNAASDGKAIKEPQVLRTRAKGIQPTMVDGLYLSAVTRTCTGIWCSSPGTTVT
jgi:hypothetical protein